MERFRKWLRVKKPRRKHRSTTKKWFRNRSASLWKLSIGRIPCENITAAFSIGLQRALTVF